MGKEFKYIIVRRQLESELLSKMEIGDFLPPLEDLCKRFNASAITINRALRELSSAGRLERIKHLGTRLCAVSTVQEEPPKSQYRLRILSCHPQQWLFMQLMEKKLAEYCNGNKKIELRCEYASRPDQIERMQSGDYDLIFADSGQVKLILHSSLLRSKLQPLHKLTNLQFNPHDYAAAAVKLGSSPQNIIYGLPLTAGPSVQLIKRSEALTGELADLSNFYDAYFPQLLKLQQHKEPMLILPLDYRYLEPVFRSYNINFFEENMNAINLESRPLMDILKMLEYYLHHQQLGLLVDRHRRILDVVQNNMLKSTPIPVQFASMINLKPGCDCQQFLVKPLPRARQNAAWLFWEGVLVGSKCDPALAGDVLNYLQSASVQSILPGCTALPARLDMQNLALAAYEPEFPGLTEVYRQGCDFAANNCAIPYEVLQELNLYLRTVICGVEPIGRSSKQFTRRINNLLRTLIYLH